MGSQRIGHDLATKQQQQTLQDNITAGKCVFPLQAHLVAAFEQSLGNMTIRLQSLTMTAEQKVKQDASSLPA